ncbi:Eisosome component PIL1-domain-containing protein [Mycena pura]|uniref:Eisosome component PIL1-domain-containing protein n=1 Tax=Mycena pura TaxID=153505 RepID=A0AAD6YK17_9AGAR|nr:Eisosome component PIL1-domain-containing protein [Mycena pura]
MLKKIAHSSTVPSLAGNKDLRPLQDLITAEKAVLISLQKASVDIAKASETLRVWGAGEGDDLNDILGASTTILGHFSAALSGYATREHAIRDHLKAVRTREEALDELKRRRKSALARADSTEKKLNKMGPEHKNLPAQTEMLAQQQAQIRQMDGEIMNEEAALGDFKRTSVRAFMGIKFGGLLECCEKGCVVAEMGRSVVSEISEEPTTPGLARTMYLGHQNTQQRVAEAERCVNEIVFSALPPWVPSSGPAGGLPQQNTNIGDGDSMTNMGFSAQNTGMSFPGGLNPQLADMGSISVQNTGVGGVDARNPYDAPPDAGSGFLPPPDVNGSFMDQRVSSGGSPAYQPPVSSPGGTYAAPGGSPAYQPPVSSPGGTYVAPGGSYMSSQGGFTPGAPDGDYSVPGGTEASSEAPRKDFGAGLSSTGEGPGGGRFATFPGAGQGQASPSLGAMTRKDTSSSDFMTAVLDAGEFGRITGTPPQGSSQGQSASQTAQMAALSAKHQEREGEKQRHQQEEDPVPEYHDYDYELALHFRPDRLRVQRHPSSVVCGADQAAWQRNRVASTGGRRRRRILASRSVVGILMCLYWSLIFLHTEPPYMKRQEPSPIASRSRREDERALNAAAAREITREMDALNFMQNGGWEFASSPTRDQPPNRDSGREQSPSHEFRPSSQEPSPPSLSITASPPESQYASIPPLANPYAPPPREPSRSPPVAGHQTAPSWDATADPQPFAPGHHTKPSWAASPVDGPGSPSSSSPRLEAPYRAPFANRSTSSLNSQVQPPPAGARTISAAAFRRPQKTPGAGGDLADTSPLAPKKRLPASPYPQQRAPSGLREPQPPAQQAPPSGDEGMFDYISAYERDSKAFFDDGAHVGSPKQTDYGHLGNVQVVGGVPASPGYNRTDRDADDIR